MTRFTEEGLREDGAALQVLAACRSPIDALECHRRFAAKATEQYLAEAGKLSEIAMTLASESLAALQSGAGEQSFGRTDAATQAGAARATVA
jgi:phasin family protein